MAKTVRLGRRYCGCGMPSVANFYVSFVLVQDVPGGTETRELDEYVCGEHIPGIEEGDFDEWLSDCGYWDWFVAEFDVTHLR